MAELKSKNTLVAVFILSIFVLARFGFPAFLERLVPHAGYIVEISLIVLASWYYRSRMSVKVTNPKLLAMDMLLAFAFGFFMFFIAKMAKIHNPLTYSNFEEIFARIVTGSILIELLFRHTLFHPVEDLVGKFWPTVVITALISAYGFLHSIFYTGQALHSFIIYQSVWMFALGLWWGYRYLKMRSLTFPIASHIIFNLGFYIGFAVLSK